MSSQCSRRQRLEAFGFIPKCYSRMATDGEGVIHIEDPWANGKSYKWVSQMKGTGG